MEDVITTESRRDALLAWQREQPRFFKESLLRDGLQLFAIEPAKAMQQSTKKYFAKAETLFLRMSAFWMQHSTQTGNDIPQLFFDGTFKIDAFLKPGQYNDSSVNDMWLYKIQVAKPVLRTLADGRNLAIVKSQNTQDSVFEQCQSLFEFSNEILVTRVLNCLVTSFEYTVTPHFTVFMGSYIAPEMLLNGPPSLFQRIKASLLSYETAPPDGVDKAASDATYRFRMYAIYERADESLHSMLPRLFLDKAFTPTQLGSLVFQILSAMEAATRVLGWSHNDAHLGNIMVRSVVGTPYENRTWGYKRAFDPQYYYITPQDHRNLMIEIIDQGRATISPEEPEKHANARFNRDAWKVLGHVENIFTTFYANGRVRGKDWDHAHFELLQAVLSQKTHARDFIDTWPRVVFSDAFHGLPNNPIIMSIVPDVNILQSLRNDPETTLVAETLQLAWGVKQGVKRVREVSCPVCFSTSVKYEAEDIAFCGKDCYHVHYGVYDVV